MTFVKEHYPKVSIKLQHSTDNVPDGQFDAYLHYARNRDNRDDGYSHTSNSDNWICTSVRFFTCQHCTHRLSNLVSV